MNPTTKQGFQNLKAQLDQNQAERHNLNLRLNTLIAEHQTHEGLLAKPRIESIWSQLS